MKLIFSKLFSISKKISNEINKLNYNLYNIRILISKFDKELRYVKIKNNDELQNKINRIIADIQSLHTALSDTEKMLYKHQLETLQVHNNEKTASNRIHPFKL